VGEYTASNTLELSSEQQQMIRDHCRKLPLYCSSLDFLAPLNDEEVQSVHHLPKIRSGLLLTERVEFRVSFWRPFARVLARPRWPGR
jgi:hypothetical protein